MHGRARLPKGYEPTPEQIEKLSKKTQLLKEAITEVLTRVRDREYNEKTMTQTAKLLKLNPELYTAWNYRKDALTQRFESEELNEKEKTEICRSELDLSSEALANNPKSYGAWYHRRWVVKFNLVDWHSEFAFVEKKLEEDSRNFHCWNYRQFLVLYFNRPSMKELEFSQRKIDQNFSNYSAWHYRCRCLEDLYKPVQVLSFEQLLEKNPGEKVDLPPLLPVDTLLLEFTIVHSAFATDPDDSSTWIYYRWLIYHLKNRKEDYKWIEVLKEEIRFFDEELLPLDPKSKWALFTYAMLIEVRDEAQGTKSEDRNRVYSTLMEVDPMRKGFYQDVRDGKASV